MSTQRYDTPADQYRSQNGGNERGLGTTVQITGVNIPFGDLVVFLIKFTLAGIPAGIIVGLIVGLMYLVGLVVWRLAGT